MLSQPQSTAKSSSLFSEGGALVIGGSGGLGSVIATTLAAYGADVAVTYNSRQAEAEQTVDRIRAQGREGLVFQVDLLDPASIAVAVETTAGAFGAIHTVVFASGPFVHLDYMSKVDPERLRHHLNSDTMGFFYLVQAALPHLRKSRGSFVACCTCGFDHWPIKDTLSVVPKAGVRAIAHGVAREEGRFGVRANVVGTGVIDAGCSVVGRATGEVPESFITGAIATTPLGRLGEADDIAEAVAYLASNKAKFVTGQVLNVDGGWSI